MSRTEKKFDAVAMMRSIRDRISAEIEGMTLEEELAWLASQEIRDTVPEASPGPRSPTGRFSRRRLGSSLIWQGRRELDRYQAGWEVLTKPPARPRPSVPGVVGLEVALGFQRRHAARARRGHRLAVGEVLHVPGREDAGHRGLRGARRPP